VENGKLVMLVLPGLVVSYLHATVETVAMGREIESLQGTVWYVLLNASSNKNFQNLDCSNKHFQGKNWTVIESLSRLINLFVCAV
jgi:hypothetical protein